MGTEVMGRWGTWEELLLGGAVLRYGTRNWNVVAAELRARTACPYTITPEVKNKLIIQLINLIFLSLFSPFFQK